MTISTITVAPLAKGDFRPPRDDLERQLYELAISRTDAWSGGQISPETYLSAVVPKCMKACSEIMQSVRRVLTADLFSRDLADQGYDPRRAMVAGMVFDAGTVRRTESEMASAISRNVTPEEVTRGLAPALIRSKTNCTVAEVAELFAIARDNGSRDIFLDTDGYHRKRAAVIGRDVEHAQQSPIHVTVHTPEEIIRRIEDRRALQPAEAFIRDVVHATAPSRWTRVKEGIKELLLYRPVHWLSHKTGGRLEQWLANRKRGPVVVEGWQSLFSSKNEHELILTGSGMMEEYQKISGE